MDDSLIPKDDVERVEALRALNVLDTPSERHYDRITEFAAALLDAPISMISLIDDVRQWTKSTHGMEGGNTPRELAFCSRAILRRGVFVVRDAQAEDEFRDNPLVVGDPGIRFYAGAPLVTSGGHVVGALCVVDRVPKDITQVQRELLQMLAAITVDFFESGRAREILQGRVDELHVRNEALLERLVAK